MDPITASALIGVGGGLIGGIFGGDDGATIQSEAQLRAQRERLQRSPAQRVAEQMFLRNQQAFPQFNPSVLNPRHTNVGPVLVRLFNHANKPQAPAPTGGGGFFAALQQNPQLLSQINMAQQNDLRGRVEAQMNKLAASLYGVNAQNTGGQLSV